MSVFRAEYKNVPSSNWIGIETASSEARATAVALNKKNSGAFAVRVVDTKTGNVVFSS